MLTNSIEHYGVNNKLRYLIQIQQATLHTLYFREKKKKSNINSNTFQ